MVPSFSPFPGLRYRVDALDAPLADLTAPPYDVIDAETQARLEAAHPNNAIHLILPRDPGPSGTPGDRYQQAATTFRGWIDAGVLGADEPRFYLYRMVFTDERGRDRTMLGVVGALELSPAGTAGVLPHERTMPKPKGDRLRLIRSVRANLDPVWGLSMAHGLSDLLQPVGVPAASCADESGAVHCLFPIDDPEAVATISRTVASAPVVIADGHHRYETAIAYRDEQRALGPGAARGADRIMALVVELAEDQLSVAGIHRLLVGVGDAFRARLGLVAELTSAGPNTPMAVERLLRRMGREAALGLVDADGLWLVTPDPDAIAGDLGQRPAALRDVDSVRLEVMLDQVGRPEGFEYLHDPAVAAAVVAKGGADAAVLLRGPSVAEITAVANAGERMPEKTSFFQPKPLTGLVFRSLDLG